jgi:glycosyltransferase involved in cell wall biosynthesis
VLGHAIAVQPSSGGFTDRAGFLFVGALPDDDTPNADSLRWFVGKVWPLVCATLGPSAKLRIVGTCQAPSVLALASASVQIVGAVPDLRPELESARVFVVPTRYAAGMPHKAHEAAAGGLPMVVTPLIADQLGWRGKVPLGAEPADFAAECLRLHEDAGHWATVREQLLAAVADDCAPAAFDSALAAVLGRRGPAQGPTGS